LSPDWEAQSTLDPYTKLTEDIDGVRETIDGFGDTVLRAKHNYWGNDDEQGSAFAVEPYVVLPTSDDGLGAEHVEFGLVLAFACSLTHDVSLEVHDGRSNRAR